MTHMQLVNPGRHAVAEDGEVHSIQCFGSTCFRIWELTAFRFYYRDRPKTDDSTGWERSSSGLVMPTTRQPMLAIHMGGPHVLHLMDQEAIEAWTWLADGADVPKDEGK